MSFEFKLTMTYTYECFYCNRFYAPMSAFLERHAVSVFFLRVKNTNIFPLETAINLTRTNRISTELEQAPIELCGFL